jgi:threonyl-tRNA synthetase
MRVELDTVSGTLGNKIRAAEGEKVPYMLIVGDKEAEAGAVAVRKRGEGDLGQRSVEQFIADVEPETKPDPQFCATPQVEG